MKITATSTSNQQNNLIPFINTQELNTRLDTMPVAEKYTLLIDSYTKDILNAKSNDFKDSKNNKIFSKIQLMESIEALYAEMAQQPAVFKTDALTKATASLLTSASFFFNTVQLGQALQLAKAGEVSLLS
jgi:hypothetical protein